MRELFDDIGHIRIIFGLGKFALETVLWLRRFALGAHTTVVGTPRRSGFLVVYFAVT